MADDKRITNQDTRATNQNHSGKSAVTGSSPVEDHSSPDGDNDVNSPKSRNDQSNDLRSGRSNEENKDMGQP